MSSGYSVSKIVYETFSKTVQEERRAEKVHEVPLVLRLTKRVERPHVTWAEGTIDNEHLGRLKSNCCCIWVKPRVWDDPTTWEQDEYEVEHCRGHTLPTPPQPEKTNPESLDVK